jgi:hypothetical protein
MKVLALPIITDTSPQVELLAELAKLGDETYREINWYPLWHHGRRIKEIREQTIAAAGELQPDFTFLQLQTEGILDGKTLEQISGLKACWNGDCRETTPKYNFDLGPFIDLFMYSNQRDVDAMRAKGHRAEFLNIGYSRCVFTPGGPKRPNTPEIVFLGNNYGNLFPRSYERQRMVAMLRERYGARFGVFGNGWGKSDVFLMEPDEAACYRSSKIAINQNHLDYRDHVDRFTSDRIFRLMGSGAFCISNSYIGIDDDFEVGKDLIVYKKIEDIPEIIDYYLAHDDERNAIAARGQKTVSERHSWAARMVQLRGIIESMRVTA